MYLRFSFIAPHLLIKCECVRYKGLWSESQDRATILNAFTMDKSYNLPHFLHLSLVNIEVHLSKEKHLCHLRQSKCVVEHMHNYSFIIPHNTILSRNRQGSTYFLPRYPYKVIFQLLSLKSPIINTLPSFSKTSMP